MRHMLVVIDTKNCMNPHLRAPISLWALCLATTCSAQHLYLSQNGSGAMNGTSCADARPYGYFNSEANWGSEYGKIAPATTVHICGTIEVPANSPALIFRGSGSPGAIITLLFEQGAILTSPAWPSSGAIIALGRQYVAVDGGVDGIIRATSNGTGRQYQLPSTAVRITGSSNVEVANLTIEDLYVHAGLDDTGPVNGRVGGCVYANGFGDGISIHNNRMHDVPWCINLQNPRSNGVTIYENEIWNADHAIAIGMSSATHSLTNLQIRHNVMHDAANWDTTLNVWHHDGIHAYNPGSGETAEWFIFGNRFYGDWGINNTAHLFIEKGISGLRIFNNVFLQHPGNRLNNGMLSLSDNNGGAIYNNTFSCDPFVPAMIAATIRGQGIAFQNNLFSGCQTYLSVGSPAIFEGASFNTNVYSGSPGGGNGRWIWQGTRVSNLTQWRGLSGADADSNEYSAIALSPDGEPMAGSAASGAATNLTPRGITQLNFDIRGSQRASTGWWDAGAYRVPVGGSEAAPPRVSITVR